MEEQQGSKAARQGYSKHSHHDCRLHSKRCGFDMEGSIATSAEDCGHQLRIKPFRTNSTKRTKSAFYQGNVLSISRVRPTKHPIVEESIGQLCLIITGLLVWSVRIAAHKCACSLLWPLRFPVPRQYYRDYPSKISLDQHTIPVTALVIASYGMSHNRLVLNALSVNLCAGAHIKP